MKHRILFLGYWNLDDGLTQATILPHLQILKNMSNVEYLHFANTQREETSSRSLKAVRSLNVAYTPLYSKNFPLNRINKIYDFIHFPKLIKALCVKHKINLIISRGAPAGSLAYLVWKKAKIPFVVESFEPHADYMKTSGEWKKYGLRYLFQKYWEQKQKNHARTLITVANNYKRQLENEGVIQSKIFVVPCAVDIKKFYTDENIKREMRTQLKISADAIVGVYAGKFGGLYLEEEAFTIFQQAFNNVYDFHLLLLTSTDNLWIKEQIQKYKLPPNRIHIKFVPYEEVNNYLNVADFAFALFKSTKVSPYLSPVKIGEYWACGLPVFITPNLGDEMHWIKEKELGNLINSNSERIFSNLSCFNPDQIRKKGIELRSLKNVSSVYYQILN